VENWKYIQPDKCLIGSKYYLWLSKNGNTGSFRKVTFIGYRPHPAEVIIDDGRGPRVIRRLDLFQRISTPDEEE
jgi:hypothetical protein